MECYIGYGLYHAATGCLYYLHIIDPVWWDYIIWNGHRGWI